MRVLVSLLVLAAPLVMSGCGSSTEPHLATVPVKGKLFVDGKPIGSCIVTLHTKDNDSEPSKTTVRRSASAKVKEDGSFVLTTYKEGDGAVPGSFSVTIEADMQDMKALGKALPVVKPLTVEIAKSADGKEIELELKLESTGEVVDGPMGKMPGM